MSQEKDSPFKFLKHEKKTYQIIGAALEVSNNLGFGFLESVYQEAMAIELEIQGIPFIQQKPIQIRYKKKLLDKAFIADFLCYEEIVIELKSIRELTKREEAQLLNYLKATGCEVGLIINFGSRKLTWKRLIHTS